MKVYQPVFGEIESSVLYESPGEAKEALIKLFKQHLDQSMSVEEFYNQAKRIKGGDYISFSLYVDNCTGIPILINVYDIKRGDEND